MLMVTDINRLPEYGFKPNGSKSWSGKDIWVFDVYTDKHNEVSLVVNPYKGRKETENEMVFVLNVDIEKKELVENMDDKWLNGYSVEYELPLEVIARMIEDGVVKRVTRKEVAA